MYLGKFHYELSCNYFQLDRTTSCALITRLKKETSHKQKETLI